ncbi:lipopolysaccharide assembly protein LapA domain-containing protein [Jatrophihabitans sp. DSM 45814]
MSNPIDPPPFDPRRVGSNEPSYGMPPSPVPPNTIPPNTIPPNTIPPSTVRPSGEPLTTEPPIAGEPAPGFDQKGRVRRTRVSGLWIGLIATALFLILLIIFVAQNSRKVSIHFFGWHGQFSLALTILLAAVIGVLLVAIPGSVRILQLRRALRKNVPNGKTN